MDTLEDFVVSDNDFDTSIGLDYNRLGCFEDAFSFHHEPSSYFNLERPYDDHLFLDNFDHSITQQKSDEANMEFTPFADITAYSDSIYAELCPSSSAVNSTIQITDNVNISCSVPPPELQQHLKHAQQTSVKRKRNLDDFVVIFSTDSGQECKAKKRKAFKLPRRKEVAMNRAIGACIQCRLRKESVCARSKDPIKACLSR